MPPFAGIAGQMVVSFFTSEKIALNSNVDWNALGKWYFGLIGERVDASPEVKQEVAALTASKTTILQKMQAIADFVQQDIRYVAVELGIGGYQPHSAAEVFAHRYGDCKDKATLLSSMLHEVGVYSYYIVINTVRGGAAPEKPPTLFWFNHVILAMRIPDDVKDSSLVATLDDPKLGRLLIFDPTDEYTPFGQLRGGASRVISSCSPVE